MGDTNNIIDLTGVDLTKLSVKAIDKLHEDYTRNLMIYLYNETALPKEVDRAKDWFTDNGYDPDISATNADFIAKAKALYPDEKDKLVLQQKAELVKTEYTTKLMRLQDIMAKQVTNSEQVEDAKGLLNVIVEIKSQL